MAIYISSFEDNLDDLLPKHEMLQSKKFGPNLWSRSFNSLRMRSDFEDSIEKAFWKRWTKIPKNNRPNSIGNFLRAFADNRMKIN